MKLTKSKLKEIIREELLSEGGFDTNAQNIHNHIEKSLKKYFNSKFYKVIDIGVQRGKSRIVVKDERLNDGNAEYLITVEPQQ